MEPGPSGEGVDFYRLYGPWAPLDPPGVKALLAGFERPWWIIGGYAIEAFTQVPRAHEDIDVSIFGVDVPSLRRHFEGRYHLWSVDDGTLRPINDRFPQPLNYVLLFKARHHRAKDDRDLEVAWPLLSDSQRGWLRESVSRLYPEHSWNERLRE
jgi:hypothetical protein